MTPETMTITITSPAQRVAVQAALAMTQELEAAAQAAPAGTVLDRCETLALDQGREVIRTTLQQVLQQRAEEAQKKGPPAAPATAAAAATSRPPMRARC